GEIGRRVQVARLGRHRVSGARTETGGGNHRQHVDDVRTGLHVYGRFEFRREESDTAPSSVGTNVPVLNSSLARMTLKNVWAMRSLPASVGCKPSTEIRLVEATPPKAAYRSTKYSPTPSAITIVLI